MPSPPAPSCSRILVSLSRLQARWECCTWSSLSSRKIYWGVPDILGAVMVGVLWSSLLYKLFLYTSLSLTKEREREKRERTLIFHTNTCSLFDNHFNFNYAQLSHFQFVLEVNKTKYKIFLTDMPSTSVILSFSVMAVWRRRMGEGSAWCRECCVSVGSWSVMRWDAGRSRENP